MKNHFLKAFTLIALVLLVSTVPFSGFSQKLSVTNDSLPTALLLVDIQDFYFPGGQLPLVNPEAASENAARVLELFRSLKLPVIHVQHEGGSPIRSNVAPVQGEKLITKKEANSFNGTDLLTYLRALKIRRLVLCGMQTHMCLEAATRAAYDYGFSCIVVGDACATRALKWGDLTVSAADVQACTLASLERFYAKVVNTADLQP